MSFQETQKYRRLPTRSYLTIDMSSFQEQQGPRPTNRYVMINFTVNRWQRGNHFALDEQTDPSPEDVALPVFSDFGIEPVDQRKSMFKNGRPFHTCLDM